MIALLGALRSVRFESVWRDGGDVYQAEFEKGSFQCVIWLGTDGKTEGLTVLPGVIYFHRNW
jgi:hypothetical protein